MHELIILLDAQGLIPVGDPNAGTDRFAIKSIDHDRQDVFFAYHQMVGSFELIQFIELFKIAGMTIETITAKEGIGPIAGQS